MVDGFGTTSADLVGATLYMGKLTAYRRFRFSPRPAFQNAYRNEWVDFGAGRPVSDRGSLSSRMELLRRGADSALVDQVFGADWAPCLTATTYGYIGYKAGAHEAYCANSLFIDSTHPAPCKTCACGFWAYGDVTYTDNIGTSSNEWTVLAAVQVWGDMIVGTRGVRAQHMQIVGVLPPIELLRCTELPIVQAWQKVVADLCVPQYGSAAELLQFHPPQDIHELLGMKQEPPTQLMAVGACGYPGCDGSCTPRGAHFGAPYAGSGQPVSGNQWPFTLSNRSNRYWVQN